MKTTIIIDSKGFGSVRNINAIIEKAVNASCGHLPSKFRNTEITVLLTTNHKIRKLNRDFRGIDKPTNVLSFPQFSPKELAKIKPNDSIGDIAIAYQYVKKEARIQKKQFKNHITHLVIHGFLHLAGYDHMTDKEADTMESLEILIMQKMHLPNPYENQ